MTDNTLMEDSHFIAYIGPSTLHDGCIREVRQIGDTVTVHVEIDSALAIALEFTDVAEVNAVQPVGMTLYALCEMTAPSPHRRFVFTNWSEDDPASLEIIAKGFRAAE